MRASICLRIGVINLPASPAPEFPVIDERDFPTTDVASTIRTIINVVDLII